jgi:hypothetical protein
LFSAVWVGSAVVAAFASVFRLVAVAVPRA